jgi:flavin-dependent dehydrogenase
MSGPPFDVAVIGGGPAGAAAALAAAREGLSVALFEPQERPDKPCGEGILPAGVAALRELGLAPLLARGVALTRVRYVLASGRTLELELAAPGCAITRPELGAALATALAAEARVARIARKVECARTPSGIEFAADGERWHARTLIAADGLHGRAAAWLRGPRARGSRTGLRARAHARTPLPGVEVHLGRASEVYLTPLPDGRVNVAVLRDEPLAGARTSAAGLAAALTEHPRAAAHLAGWIDPPESRQLARTRPRRTAAAGAFLAGDAGGGIDPVLGCGVALALYTGLAAGRAAARVLAHGSGEPERAYRRLVRRETSLRDALARGVVFLAAHPGLQDVVARVLGAWPRASKRLAALVAGA